MNREIHRIEVEVEAASDERTEVLKKQRLALADEMREALRARATVGEWRRKSGSLADPALAPRIGDRIGLGISHPCTTFDKWRWMPVADAQGVIVDAITTGF